MRAELESKPWGWGELSSPSLPCPASLPPPQRPRWLCRGRRARAGCPDLSASPARLLQLPCLFKAACRKGSRTAFIMQITRVNGQIPRWALEWNAELLAAGRGGRGGGALFAGLCSNLTAMAAKGDTRDLLSSLALPVACQGHRQGRGKEGGSETPRRGCSTGSAALRARSDAPAAGHLPAPGEPWKKSREERERGLGRERIPRALFQGSRECQLHPVSGRLGSRLLAHHPVSTCGEGCQTCKRIGVTSWWQQTPQLQGQRSPAAPSLGNAGRARVRARRAASPTQGDSKCARTIELIATCPCCQHRSGLTETQWSCTVIPCWITPFRQRPEETAWTIDPGHFVPRFLL